VLHTVHRMLAARRCSVRGKATWICGRHKKDGPPCFRMEGRPEPYANGKADVTFITPASSGGRSRFANLRYTVGPWRNYFTAAHFSPSPTGAPPCSVCYFSARSTYETYLNLPDL
jgi:hypothetical protein